MAGALWPLVVDVPANISDKFLQSKEFDLLVQFFGGCPRPLLCNDSVMVQTVQKTVLVPQLQFIEGRRGKLPWSCLFRKP